MKGPKPLFPPKGKMGRSKGQMGDILKQAQKMQAEMARVQEEVARMEVESSAGGGAVTARINGEMELISLRLDPDVVDPEDTETLEDLIIVAVNQALREMKAKSDERMASITGTMGGMGMPGLPF